MTQYSIEISDNKNLLEQDKRDVIASALKSAVDSLNESTEIVEIRFFREYGKLNLTVFIWNKNGVDLKACERVHNAVSAVLDGLDDMFDSEYILNVSSSGLDRLIKNSDDFRRATDSEIEVFCSDKSKVHGILKCFDGENITITVSGKTAQDKIIPLHNTTKVQPYLRF